MRLGRKDPHSKPLNVVRVFGRSRGDDAGQAQKVFATDGFAFYGQLTALVIIEARAFSQLLLDHADFLLEVFNDDLLVAVHPSGTAN